MNCLDESRGPYSTRSSARFHHFSACSGPCLRDMRVLNPSLHSLTTRVGIRGYCLPLRMALVRKTECCRRTTSPGVSASPVRSSSRFQKDILKYKFGSRSGFDPCFQPFSAMLGTFECIGRTIHRLEASLRIRGKGIAQLQKLNGSSHVLRAACLRIRVSCMENEPWKNNFRRVRILITCADRPRRSSLR